MVETNGSEMQWPLRLHSLISDHMVLQRGVPAPVRGWAAPGEQITVALGGRTASAKADAEGRWKVTLEAMEAGGPFEMEVRGEKRSTVVRDVCVGEVWVCSGQSNMEMVVGPGGFWWGAGVYNHEQEIAGAKFPLVRQFYVHQRVAGRPQEDAAGEWKVCSPETVGRFTAVGYFFARDLFEHLQVPVGIVNASWGGMPAESFTTAATMEAMPECHAILERHTKAMEAFPPQLQAYEKAFMEWMPAAAQAEEQGGVAPGAPTMPGDPRSNPGRPGGLYNAMIHPLTGYAIRGALWYQGESNADRACQYRTLFPAMIRDWRRAWGQGDFPFYFVQLANFGPNGMAPEATWAELREAQTRTLALPNTAMAVAIDIGDTIDIHPRNKQDVGRRLALAAKNRVYGAQGAYSGPMYESMVVEDGTIRLRFTHTDGGLVAKGADGLPSTQRALCTFVIAGEDRQFVAAEAKIDGDTVVVWSDQVKQPVATRYAWMNDPQGCNLYNAANLPASPFRTDDWPGVTEGKM